MATNHILRKRRIWVGLSTAGVGVGLWVWWTQAHPPKPVPTMHSRQPFVQLASVGTAAGDKLLQERAQLLDPTPLFFPTEWNYGQQPLRENKGRQPGQVFGRFPPKQTVDERNISKYGAEAPVVPEKLADVLAQGNEAPFAGMGQIDRPLSTLPVRSAYVSIWNIENGDKTVSQPLSGLALPRSDFAPVEFLVVIEASGLIGDPIMTMGSGWDEVDNFFRSYLVKSYRLGERLPPGRYRVVIGA